MFEFKTESQMKDFLIDNNNGNFTGGFCFYAEEETVSCHQFTNYKWDFIGKDNIFFYLVELKTNCIEKKVLEKMQLYSYTFRSFKPVKIILMTPAWSKTKQARIKEYDGIIHIQIDKIRLNKKLIKPTVVRKTRLINDDYEIDALKKFSYVKRCYFDYFLGYKVENGKYMLFEFRFENSLGIIFKSSIKVDDNKRFINDIYYQIIYYEFYQFQHSDYYEVIRTYKPIRLIKINGLFEKINSIPYYFNNDEYHNVLLNMMDNFDKVSISDYLNKY